jgi:tRNA A-37 threonylcarbamoyl transferase component Bud32
MIGQAVGNYVVREQIGQGGMGAVYVAEHTRLGRRVAVKVLLPHMVASKEMASRFFNEAKAAADIRNAHIVDVLDFGDLPDGSSYIVMEWLEGQSLQKLIERERRLPLQRVAHIAQGIARALGAAHSHGIVHRDLKPDNIFLVQRDDDADFVKVLDFGIAKLSIDSTDVRTQTGAILGTPHYMSPEQCNGGNVDRRTDVYAMGVILYQLLTGRLPFVANKLTELLIAHATQPPPPLRTLDPNIPPAVEQAVLQALEKDPERRFSSVEALARAFVEEVRATNPGLPTPYAQTAPAATPIPQTTQTAGEVFVRVGIRGKTPKILLGALAAVGALVIVALLLMRSPAPNEVGGGGGGGGGGAPPAAAVKASSGVVYGGTWKLTSTDCFPGSVPATVVVTQNGSTVSSHAPGFPATTGSVEPDGHFRVHNALGSCSGRVNGNSVSETCTNKLHMSCHVTYQRIN